MAELPYSLESAYDPASPKTVSFEDAAIRAFDDFRAWAEQRSVDASPLMKGALGKAPGHVLRLSGVLEFLRWASDAGELSDEPQTICEISVETACAMMENYFFPMAERVLGDASIPVAEMNAARLAQFLVTDGKPHFSAREAGRRLNGGMRDSKVMNAACEELVAAGLIRPAGKPSGQKGRAPKVFSVNPALFAISAPTRGKTRGHLRLAEFQENLRRFLGDVVNPRRVQIDFRGYDPRETK